MQQKLLLLKPLGLTQRLVLSCLVLSCLVLGHAGETGIEFMQRVRKTRQAQQREQCEAALGAMQEACEGVDISESQVSP